MARHQSSLYDSVQTVAVEIDEVVRQVASVFTREIAAQTAAVFSDQPVFPDKIVVDRPDDAERRFPGYPSPVLLLSDENQGVCSWGVPIGQDRLPVLVGGDISDEPSSTTIEYASDIAAFVAARRWDHACLGQTPLIQAQANAIDDDALAFLKTRYRETLPTAGWPGCYQRRLEDDRGCQILLWMQSRQCDWWISA